MPDESQTIVSVTNAGQSLTILRSLLPPRNARRPALADWLSVQDIQDDWRQIKRLVAPNG